MYFGKRYYCLKAGRIGSLRGGLSFGKIARGIDLFTGVMQTTRATVWWWNHAGVKYLREDDMPRMEALAAVLGVDIRELLDLRDATESEWMHDITGARRET